MRPVVHHEGHTKSNREIDLFSHKSRQIFRQVPCILSVEFTAEFSPQISDATTKICSNYYVVLQTYRERLSADMC